MRICVRIYNEQSSFFFVIDTFLFLTHTGQQSAQTGAQSTIQGTCVHSTWYQEASWEFLRCWTGSFCLGCFLCQTDFDRMHLKRILSQLQKTSTARKVFVFVLCSLASRQMSFFLTSCSVDYASEKQSHQQNILHVVRIRHQDKGTLFLMESEHGDILNTDFDFSRQTKHCFCSMRCDRNNRLSLRQPAGHVQESTDWCMLYVTDDSTVRSRQSYANMSVMISAPGHTLSDFSFSSPRRTPACHSLLPASVKVRASRAILCSINHLVGQ